MEQADSGKVVVKSQASSSNGAHSLPMSGKLNAPGKSNARVETVPVIPQKELYQRLNYSYQAAIFLQSLGSTSACSSSTRSDTLTAVRQADVGIKVDRKGKKKAVELVELVDVRESGNDAGNKFRKLARLGMRESRVMSVHNQLKIDASFKRSVCKACSTILIPGLTSRIRNRPNRNSFSITHHTCLTCSTSLSIPAPPLPCSSSSPDPAPDSPAKKSLDGPIRSARRRRASKRDKTSFHQLEKTTDAAVPGETEGSGNMDGHVLWKGSERVKGWGSNGYHEEFRGGATLPLPGTSHNHVDASNDGFDDEEAAMNG
ncbi:hypothetical protein I317_02058 [Kwoniella heveanensis CBS 569]|nr:hypothetical protein I317_02058 [Kwoniella heveanensis CBS 569]